MDGVETALALTELMVIATDKTDDPKSTDVPAKSSKRINHQKGSTKIIKKDQPTTPFIDGPQSTEPSKTEACCLCGWTCLTLTQCCN